MNYLKVLGASGSKTKLAGTTSFQVYKNIIVDAGNVINSLGQETLHIDHLFLTHKHSDHILDVPFMIEGFYEKRNKPLTIYGAKETIQSLKKHTFNDDIWPDFSKIKLINCDKPAIIYKVLEEFEEVCLGDYCFTPVKMNHIPGSFGYSIIKDNINGYFITGDTFKTPKLWEYLNKNKKIKSLIIECSFPSEMEHLATQTKHLTPQILNDELAYLKRDDIQVFIHHLKPLYINKITSELKNLDFISNYNGKILKEGDVIHINSGLIESDFISKNRFEKIMDINLELSSELNKEKLFDMILTLTRELTNAEAGTLYIVSKDRRYLEFKVVQNSKLNISMGETKKIEKWDKLPLYLNKNQENKTMVSVVSALEKRIININNIYKNKEYSFEGTKNFDEQTGYYSKSMLVIPLLNHEYDVIGILQLINKTDYNNKIIGFNAADEKLLKALASQAAMALTNSYLINSLEEFLNSFVTTIAHAIDAKSTHTHNHIGKVVKISKYIAQAIHEDETLYKDVKYSKNHFRQIELAALMHDVGKISIPEAIIDKGTKLQAMIDGIEIIKNKFELIKKEFEISYLKNEISKKSFEENIKNIENDFKFLQKVNIGGEFMKDKDIKKIHKIANYSYKIDGVEHKLLDKQEIEKLSIRKGTLTKEEKDIMNSHAQLSLDMLSTLPFPKKYNNTFNIAVNHHEKLNGKGYPRGLKEKDLSLEDKIMILSDIFEALTASDRPYKKGKKLSEVFTILSQMAKDKEIDAKLLKFFHDSKVLENYCKEELKEYQLDKSELNI